VSHRCLFRVEVFSPASGLRNFTNPSFPSLDLWDLTLNYAPDFVPPEIFKGYVASSTTDKNLQKFVKYSKKILGHLNV
jgi:hypothetical protein